MQFFKKTFGYLLAAVCLVAISHAANADAEDLQYYNKVVVTMDTPSDDAVADGLDIGAIKTEIENRLKSSHITVNPTELASTNLALDIDINTIKITSNPAYVYDITITGDVNCNLVAHPSTARMCTIWTNGSFGIVSVNNFSNKMNAKVDEIIDLFISDYKSQHTDQATLPTSKPVKVASR